MKTSREAEHAALAFLAALLDVGHKPESIIAAIDVIKASLLIGTAYHYTRADGTVEVLDPARLKIVVRRPGVADDPT